ncbi:MAG: PEP-CTERM sorting domain-containing protein [Isosphaeraceae bacterium]|nr:PEP-CTERM sorting domain-containing protein [Isosphaeraceae bacterium]
MTKFIRFAALLGLFVILSPVAQATNLVVNPGFETGDLTGWTLMDGSGLTFVGDATTLPPLVAHTGTYFTTFAASVPESIEQDIPTTPGTEYTFSFWLMNETGLPSGVPPTNGFQALASWNGTAVLELVNSPAFGYTLFTFNVTATSAISTIKFSALNENFGWGLDDVSLVAVTAVPEPTTVALAGLGIVFGVARGRRRA